MIRRRNRGVVLVSVLLVVVLLTAVVYRLSARHSLNLAASQNAAGRDQLVAYALGGEVLARQVLYQDFHETGQGRDTLTETWATATPPLELDGQGWIRVQVRDLNGCFNLNALAVQGAGDQALDQLSSLLARLELPTSIGARLKDWLDSDHVRLAEGAEDSDYLLAAPAYRAANRPLAHASELRLLRGLTAEQYARLAPHACVVPEATFTINVNTATPLVLAALMPDVVEARLQTLAEGVRNYAEVVEFLREFPEAGPQAEWLSVSSAYFEVQTEVRMGAATFVLTSRLHRDPEIGSIALISRDFSRQFQARAEPDPDATGR